MAPFWQTRPLAAMTTEQWESLCDHCGRCCLVKLEDEDTGDIFTTRVVCAQYDIDCGRCGDYAHRFEKVADCIDLTPENVGAIPWLPETCAYRRLHEGRDLPDWHPLVTGDPDSTRKAGMAIAEEVVREDLVDIDDLPRFIHDWNGGAGGGAKK